MQVVVVNGSTWFGLEVKMVIMLLGRKKEGIHLSLRKKNKEAGYWKLKVILFNDYLLLCSS